MKRKIIFTFIDFFSMIVSISLSFLLSNYLKKIILIDNYRIAYSELIIFEFVCYFILIFLIKPYGNILNRSNSEEISNVFYSIVINFILCIMYLFISRRTDSISRVFLLFQYLGNFLFICLFRNIVKAILKKGSMHANSRNKIEINNSNFKKNNEVKKTGKIKNCCILGVNISAVNMGTLVTFVSGNLKLIHGEYICVANVHTTVTSYENEEYREIQNNSILTIPDGGPLSSLGKRKGFNEMERTTGPDFMEEIFKLSKHKHYKHFFYGSSNDTLVLMKENILKQYPDLEIVGMYSPPFRELTTDEDKTIIKMINDAHPDFVWVGLGAPKQEIWMAEHKGIINGLMVGVGAAFDYKAGKINRAPKWMQESDLEWLYRLIQEPQRLFKRYFKTNFKFILYAWILRK